MCIVLFLLYYIVILCYCIILCCISLTYLDKFVCLIWIIFISNSRSFFISFCEAASDLRCVYLSEGSPNMVVSREPLFCFITLLYSICFVILWWNKVKKKDKLKTSWKKTLYTKQQSLADSCRSVTSLMRFTTAQPHHDTSYVLLNNVDSSSFYMYIEIKII